VVLRWGVDCGVGGVSTVCGVKAGCRLSVVLRQGVDCLCCPWIQAVRLDMLLFKIQGAYKLSEDFAKPYFHKY
jgi:hypothetical protein